jgi:hypothetical protein
MHVLVFEDNLLWSTRLQNSLRSLGHVPEVLTSVPASTDAPLAIVNLGASRFDPAAVVPALRALGVFVIGHAGHQEKAVLGAGKDAGCDRLATNSQITFDLKKVIELANLPGFEAPPG